MEEFLRRFQNKVIGVLCGWDRIRLQGTRRLLASVEGFKRYLHLAGMFFKDFREHALETTARLRQNVEQREAQEGREVHFLPSSKTDKDGEVRKVLGQRGIKGGLVGVWSCVESCRSVGIYGNRATHKLEMKIEEKQCLHYYHYYLDERFGLLNTGLQTEIPLHIT